MIERLFLYGTLLDSTRTPMARWLSPRLRNGRAAHVAGRLMAIPNANGFYPALIRSDRRRTFGTVFDVALSPSDWGVLDRYEGDEYRRAATLFDARGSRPHAQFYRWAGFIPARARPIPGGNFRQWLKENGCRPYGGPFRDGHMTRSS